MTRNNGKSKMITRGKDTMYYIHQDYCAQSCQYEHEYVTSIND